jgi:predicted ATPase/DNA-binding CsgD family transcriptional regulator
MAIDAELFGDALPTYLTRFVGRERECRALASAVHDATLVTISGVGGAGKTRLALEVAKQIRDDHADDAEQLQVYWVPLSGVNSPAEVGPAIATGIALTGSFTDHQLGAIISVLRTRRVLLLLDNCEQVAATCRGLVGQLLTACPRLKVLATSRIPLGLTGEVVYSIPPLGSEATTADPYATDATELFIDRAARLAPAYVLTGLNGQAVSDICRLLDGSPLAIELAASWIRVLSPHDLLARLSTARSMLQSDTAVVEDRHRSMQAVLDSSWHWLGSTERSVLSALAVCVGGCTIEAAQAVAGAGLDSVARLTELSLLQRLPDPSGGSRYHVHELVRVYALNRLERPEVVRGKHLCFFLDLVERSDVSWNAPTSLQSIDPVNADLANIDAATDWALECGDAERAQRLAVGLDQFWISCSLSYEHRLAQLQAALDLPGPLVTGTEIRARAQALRTVGLRLLPTDPTSSHAYFREARPLFEQVGDAAGVAACIREHGNARLLEGDFVGCRRDCLASLVQCRACGDLSGATWCLETIGAAALAGGDWAEAVDYLSRAAQDFTGLDTPAGTCCSEMERALAHQIGGQWVEAVDACVRALDCEQRYRLTAQWAEIIKVVARLCAELHHWAAAAQLYGAALSWHSDNDAVSWFPVVSRFSRVDQVRRHLGEPAWIEANETGQLLGSDRATQLAYECLTELRSELDASSSGLSRRQIEVLRLVAAGLTDADIAARLVVSPRTIHAHLRLIYQKLDVTSRTAAAATGIALETGDGARSAEERPPSRS